MGGLPNGSTQRLVGRTASTATGGAVGVNAAPLQGVSGADLGPRDRFDVVSPRLTPSSGARHMLKRGRGKR